MSKRFIFLILLLAILLFSFPMPASAFLWDLGAADFASYMLGGIEELAGPVAVKILGFFYKYVIATIALYASVVLLETAIDPNLVSLAGDLVRTGWQFTVGVANMFIIIILIYIAFSFILNQETYEMKKTLPRLILVAFLLNFSLLFVGMLVDIGNITINTFFEENENLPSLVSEMLLGSMVASMGLLCGAIAFMATLFIIPYTAPFAQLGLVLAYVLAGPLLFTMVFQLVSAFLISAIFFVYALLFIARVFIIQLLAIIAPLAFLALILPQTKKYWDKWLLLLLEWVFLGVVLFFFMTLGLKGVYGITPEPGMLFLGIDIFPWLRLDKYFIYYLFLVIYLVAAFGISKAAMPTFAQAAIDQATGLGQMAWGRVAVPLGGAIKARAQQFAAGQETREKELEAAKTGAEKAKISPWKGLAMGAGHYMRRGIESVHWAAGTTVPAAMERNLNEKAAEYEKRYGKDFVGAAQNFPNIRRDFDQAALALYLEKTKGGKALGGLSDENYLRATEAVAKYSPARLDDIVKHRVDLFNDEEAKGERHKRIAKLVQNTMVSDGINIDSETGEYKDKDIRKMVSAGVKIDNVLIDDLIKTDEGKIKVIREATYKKAVDALKNEDVDNLADKTLSDSKFQEMTARYRGVSFIRKIGEEKGSEYIRAIRQKTEELGAEEIVKTNDTLLRSAIVNPGFKAVFPSIEGAETIEKLEELLKAHEEKSKIRAKTKPAPPASTPTPTPTSRKQPLEPSAGI